MKKLAIVILNWNGADMMRQYLPTVLQNSVGEVIVADNASTDGSVQMLLKEFPDVPLVVMEQNFGFAEGYNRALAQLPDYEYYLLLNSDVEIRQQNWDAPMIQYMDEHPDCAACQPKLLKLQTQTLSSPSLEGESGIPANEDKGAQHVDVFEYAGAAGGFLDKYGYPFCRGRVFDTIEPDQGQYDGIVPLLWGTGAALMVRASDWRESGGLDARFFAHMEEIDLCWRLRTMGKSIVCISESKAYHLGGATLNQGNPRKTFLNFRNNLLMLYKNLPDAELKRVMRTRRFLDYLAALQFLLKGDTQNCAAVFKARRAFRDLRPDFEKDRRHIQQLRKDERVSERVEFSLLWQYYVKGKKTFKDLMG
ncbi:MAG: glycosyltransferase family 2 protein [Bacteroidaceae bacterium]|nr:glycosyltransferase family 2 protein [Bacteroidaceae bacterium]